MQLERAVAFVILFTYQALRAVASFPLLAAILLVRRNRELSNVMHTLHILEVMEGEYAPRPWETKNAKT